MILENFFTLTEVKKGLATLGRVEELINTIQQKNYSVNNISDATRQWTSVAAAIAATENEDCLNYFVKLNGLSYLGQWVQQVLEHGNYNADSIAEEFLCKLICLLEKLPIFKAEPASSEIQIISEKLIGLKILKIDERVKALSEKWKHTMEVDASYQNLNDDKKGKDDNLDASGCPLNGFQLDRTVDLLTEKVNKDIGSSAISEDIAALPNAISLKSNLIGDANEDHLDASPCTVDKPENIIINMDIEQVSPSKSDVKEAFQVPLSFNSSAPSKAHKPERSRSCNFDVQKKSNALKSVMALPRSASIDCDLTKHMGNINLKPDIQDLLSNGSAVKGEDSSKDTSCGNMEEVENGGTSEVNVDSSKSSEDNKSSTVRVDHTLDFGFEYGEIDALEVARQVAIEVEREVVDYREPFCSSSPDCSSREEDVVPKCFDRHHSQQVNQNKKDLENSSVSEKTDIPPDRCKHDVEMPSKQEAVNKANKTKHVFDLNEDICIEESDSVVISNANNSANISISTPIAVAASKGSPVLPVSPLQFEGELGWKGSAATSAFRSTSSRRNSDVEKTSSGHKRKAVFIEFDLNVAGKECDPDPVPIDPIKVPSREDSIEVSSKRPEIMKLDLNQIGDEETSPPQATMSPASSSSKDRRMRDFDLNDNPSFFDVMGSQKKHEISIMGSRITDKNDRTNELFNSSFCNGPNMVMPYGNFPLHPSSAYNGSVMGHFMAFPVPHHANGHIPYMVDSRGTPMVPQLFGNMGLNSNPSSSSSTPHFLMSLNGAGTSQSGLDRKSMENGNFKNFFMQGRIGLTEEQVRAASQPQGTMSRKEANSGREPYNFMASWQ